MGYTFGQNFFVVPHDWRIHPYFTDFVDSFKRVVEYAYSTNGNSRVVLLGLSDGTLMSRYALSMLDQKWKDTHISHLIMTSHGMGWGSDPAFTITGVKYCSGLVFDSSFTKYFMYWTHLFLWLPEPRVYKDNVIIYTPSRNYTAAELTEYFRDANATFALNMYPLLYNNFDLLQPPGVKVYPLIGTNSQTTFAALYATDDLGSGPAKFTFSDGDGDEDIVGQRGVYSWKKDPHHEIIIKEYPGYNYLSWYGYNESAMNLLADIILNG
jgi:hypothetical protein